MTVCLFLSLLSGEDQTMKKLLLLCWIVAAVSVTGCGSKSSESALSSDVDTTQYNQIDADAALLEEARRMVKDVFFEFDSAELDQMAMSQLKNNAAWLVDNQSISVMIEGHCDERGTYEYNMALGERRAEVTKGFLERAGVNGARLETVSYGEEKPFDPGHNEAAWAKNRRAHFMVK